MKLALARSLIEKFEQEFLLQFVIRSLESNSGAELAPFFHYKTESEMEEILKECHWDGQYGKSLDELITYANDGPDRTIQAGSAVHASLKNMMPLFKKIFELANKETEVSNV